MQYIAPCAGDIFYSIEESEDASSCNIPVDDHQLIDRAGPQHLEPMRHIITLITMQYTSSYNY